MLNKREKFITIRMKKSVALISGLAALTLAALVFRGFNTKHTPPDPYFTSGILVAEDATGRTVLSHDACPEAPTLQRIHITTPGGSVIDGCWMYKAPNIVFIDSKTMRDYSVKLSLFHHEE